MCDSCKDKIPLYIHYFYPKDNDTWHDTVWNLIGEPFFNELD